MAKEGSDLACFAIKLCYQISYLATLIKDLARDIPKIGFKFPAKLSVYRADSGTYTCEAQNEYGKAESSGDLFVKQGPTFQV